MILAMLTKNLMLGKDPIMMISIKMNKDSYNSFKNNSSSLENLFSSLHRNLLFYSHKNLFYSSHKNMFLCSMKTCCLLLVKIHTYFKCWNIIFNFLVTCIPGTILIDLILVILVCCGIPSIDWYAFLVCLICCIPSLFLIKCVTPPPDPEGLMFLIIPPPPNQEGL